MGFAVGHRGGVQCAASGCAVGLAVLAAATGTRAAAPLATVSVTLSDFGIRLSVGAVRDRKVTFRVVNRGNVAHDFAIAGRRTRVLAHGARATLTVTVARPGGYRFSSTRAGEAPVGMTGIFRLGTQGTGTAPIVTRSRLKLTPVSTGLVALAASDSPPGPPAGAGPARPTSSTLGRSRACSGIAAAPDRSVHDGRRFEAVTSGYLHAEPPTRRRASVSKLLAADQPETPSPGAPTPTPSPDPAPSPQPPPGTPNPGPDADEGHPLEVGYPEADDAD